MKKVLVGLLIVIGVCSAKISPGQPVQNNTFAVRGFHLDLRIQVMTIPALREFASTLSKNGINTLVMEWEATYPFEKQSLIPNRYAYTKEEVTSFIAFCKEIGIDVIPLQQSFGHVEYILRHPRYKDLREDQKDYSQVCPLQEELDKALFRDLFSELAATHPSKYFHIGGDETYLLGHCARCSLKAKEQGKSKLYIDHIKMLCDLVIQLGKRPVLWADIALAYPEAIKLLPKETIFIDWNYGWDFNRFGDHKKLVESGYEIWGAPSIRSHPDNYFLTQWEKHFKNIRDFIPAARQIGYKGIIMTSWSTSGQYSAVNESSTDIIDLYAIRHLYPITGFSMLIQAYFESLASLQPLNIETFIEKYAADKYGFNKEQSAKFRSALKMAPYEIQQGEVKSPRPMSVQNLLDSASMTAETFRDLVPSHHKDEFEHHRLMADVRVYYLTYQRIEKQVNSDAFTKEELPNVISLLKNLLADSEKLNKRFIALNKHHFYTAELQHENDLRNSKVKILYDRLTRQRNISK
jgi:hexosaminidase